LDIDEHVKGVLISTPCKVPSFTHDLALHDVVASGIGFRPSPVISSYPFVVGSRSLPRLESVHREEREGGRMAEVSGEQCTVGNQFRQKAYSRQTFLYYA